MDDVKERVPLADKLALSPEQASELSGIGLTRIREAIADRTLIAHKHGSRTIVLPDDLKAWLRSLPDAGIDGVERSLRPPQIAGMQEPLRSRTGGRTRRRRFNFDARLPTA